MGINQVSLFFYPPRWRQRVTADSNALAWGGKAVQIADAVRDPSGGSRAVTGEELGGWLAGQGFTAASWGEGGIFERGQVQSIFGIEKEIQINVGEEAGEVVELYCRFTLPRRTPPPLVEWGGFVASLCERFGMRLGSEVTEPCSAAEFIAAVLGDGNYQDFAARFSWRTPAT